MVHPAYSMVALGGAESEEMNPNIKTRRIEPPVRFSSASANRGLLRSGDMEDVMPILALEAVIPCRSSDNEDHVTVSFNPSKNTLTIEQFQGTWFILSKDDLLEAIRIVTTGKT